MNDTVNIKNGKLFINGIEVPFEVYNKLVTEEIDKEVLKDLRKHYEQKKLSSNN